MLHRRPIAIHARMSPREPRVGFCSYGSSLPLSVEVTILSDGPSSAPHVASASVSRPLRRGWLRRLTRTD